MYVKMVNKYYQKHKERLRKEAREKYESLPQEEKYKRSKKACETYESFTEGEKEKRCLYYQERNQKLPEYRKKLLFNT